MNDIVTTVSNALESAAKWVINLLPMSPFQSVSNAPIQQYMPNLGWLIPVNEILAILSLWVVAIGVFYMYQAILRLTRMIE